MLYSILLLLQLQIVVPQQFYSLTDSTNQYILTSGKETRYLDYCTACYLESIKPLPEDVWSAGGWGGNSGWVSFHPKPDKPTGLEDKYWHQDVPIGSWGCLLIFIAIYCFLSLPFIYPTIKLIKNSN